jgi:hypothetical protein
VGGGEVIFEMGDRGSLGGKEKGTMELAIYEGPVVKHLKDTEKG